MIPTPSPVFPSASLPALCSKCSTMWSAWSTVLCAFDAFDIGNCTDTAVIMLKTRVIQSRQFLFGIHSVLPFFTCLRKWDLPLSLCHRKERYGGCSFTVGVRRISISTFFIEQIILLIFLICKQLIFVILSDN